MFVFNKEVPRDRDMSEDEDEQDPDDRYTRKFITHTIHVQILILKNDLNRKLLGSPYSAR